MKTYRVTFEADALDESGTAESLAYCVETVLAQLFDNTPKDFHVTVEEVEPRPIKDYHVAWEIDLSAESPQDAARRALDMVSHPKSTAHVFSVREFATDDPVQVDLDEE